MVKKEVNKIRDMIKTISDMLVKNGFTAREIMIVLREIENDAMIALIMGQIVQNVQGLQETQDDK